MPNQPILPPALGPPLPPPAPQPQSHRDANSSAKAARAFAKAQRPWYKKKRYLGLGVLVLLVVVIAAASSGGSTSTPAASDPGTTATVGTLSEAEAPAAPKPPVAGGTTLPIQNGDWRLDSIRVKNDGLGSFGGAARVTYTGKDDAGGNNIFTLTVFKAGKDIAVLNGSANSVAPGATVTVQFISSDKFVVGPYSYDFQNDL